MGKNRHTREPVAGQTRTIRIHQEKILAELAKPFPNMERVRKWEPEIDNAGKRVRPLEERLKR